MLRKSTAKNLKNAQFKIIKNHILTKRIFKTICLPLLPNKLKSAKCDKVFRRIQNDSRHRQPDKVQLALTILLNNLNHIQRPSQLYKIL